MSHRNRRNPFRRAPKSPFNEDGPNATSLRRGLEWLERHDRDVPSRETSVELQKQSKKVATQAADESAKPASHEQPDQHPAESETSQTEAIEEQPENVAPEEAQEVVRATPIPDEPSDEFEHEPETVRASDEEFAETERPESEAAGIETAETEVVSVTDEANVDESEMDETETTTTELANIEATHIEEGEIRNSIHPANIRTLDRRRFPRREAQSIDLVKHQRCCKVCQHPQREIIEEAFLDWRRSADIRYEFDLPNRSCIYRHAHAFGLFQLRTRNMRLGLENIIEESSHCVVTAESVIRAIRAHSCLDENGRWIEPPRRVIISRETLPKQPRRKAKSRKRRTKKMGLVSRERDAYLTLSPPTDLPR